MNIFIPYVVSAVHMVQSLLQTKSQVPQTSTLHMAFGSSEKQPKVPSLRKLGH